MDAFRSALNTKENHLEIVRLYYVEGWTLEEVMLEMERRHLRSGPKLSEGKWKSLLKAQGIFKNFSEGELVFIRSTLRQIPGTWSCLVFADDVLQHNIKVKQHYDRKRGNFQEHGASAHRTIKFIPLAFDLKNILSEPIVFKNFRRLLFYIRVHFESSFDSGIWTPDERGLYARSDELRAELTLLSHLHNKCVEALTQFKAGRSDRGSTLMQAAFEIQKNVLEVRHHRQISDIYAILLLFHRDGYGLICETMVDNSLKLARLLDNDPRRVMLDSLKGLAFDSDGHQYLALDVYCRHLWMSRMGHDDVKAHYSYNQASFPRADVGGFYDFYKGKSLEQINIILRTVDMELGKYSHETFCIWQTAIRFLERESRYEEMLDISQRMRASRLGHLGEEFDYDRQLNLDSSLTLYLLGKAHDALGNLETAGINYIDSLMLRGRVVAEGKFDPTKVAALRKLESVSRKLGHPEAELWRGMLNQSYSIVEA